MNYIEQLMKDNDIKIGEEFYIKHKGAIEWVRGDVKYHFDENYFLVSEEDELKDFGHMNQLLTGSCKIEKISEEQKTIYDLKEKDMYYFINPMGDVIRTFHDSDEDNYIVEIGNAFLTREQAEFELERRKCEAILLKYGTRDMMSLGDERKVKHLITYDHKNNCFHIDFYLNLQTQGTIYFESKELAHKAIKECGQERLKRYVFNVKE